MSLWRNIFGEAKESKHLLGDKQFKILVGGFFVLGIAMLAFGTVGENKEDFSQVPVQSAQKEQEAAAAFGKNSIIKDTEAQLENQLKTILQKVQGAGDVDVQITLDTSKEYVYAQNETRENSVTEETDNTGGKRITKSDKKTFEIVTMHQGNGESPVILKEIESQIRGVLVVAEGASNSAIKAKLTLAVETALGLPAHKVLVLAKE